MKGGTTIVGKVAGALLALLAVSFLVFVSCGVPGIGSDPKAPPLDDAARRSCAVFSPVASDVRDGRLTGPPLFRVLQEAFNQASQSQTPGFPVQVQELYTAAINGNQPAVTQRADGLQARCAAG